MSETHHKEDDDVMNMQSVGDEYDMTHEEENSLLEVSEDINIDENNRSDVSVRQKIVFDLNDTYFEDNDSNDKRHRFKSERQTNGDQICLSLNESKRRQIPDSLDSVMTRNSMRNELNKGKSRKRNRNRSRKQTNTMNNRINDLREVIGFHNRIGVNTNNANNRSLSNRLNLSNCGLDLTQINTFITLQSLLNVNQSLIQNQLINSNSLSAFSQNQTNHFHNNYSHIEKPFMTINNNKMKKNRDELTITFANSPQNSSPKTRVNTLPKIRCIFKNDGLEKVESNEYKNENNIKELIQIRDKNGPKFELKTKFAKHLANKVNESKLNAEKAKSGDSFMEALAEAQVGVDNEYLLKMEEIKQQRLELQKRKEQRRYEMADERLENANDLQEKLKMSNKRSFARHQPY